LDDGLDQMATRLPAPLAKRIRQRTWARSSEPADQAGSADHGADHGVDHEADNPVDSNRSWPNGRR